MKSVALLSVLFFSCDDDPVEQEEAMTCAANWQASRISDTGEISTEGNTMVYPGSQSMGGMERRVDVEKTVGAFYYMNTLSNDANYGDMVGLVFGFYK